MRPDLKPAPIATLRPVIEADLSAFELLEGAFGMVPPHAGFNWWLGIRTTFLLLKATIIL
jgi:hypothetical protein